jgi:hypothetical protein
VDAGVECRTVVVQAHHVPLAVAGERGINISPCNPPRTSSDGPPSAWARWRPAGGLLSAGGALTAAAG